MTVGTQGPFDRLVRTVDDWASRAERSDVFAQVGDTSAPPTSIEWVRSLSHEDFLEKVRDASAVISHAGMGTILMARRLGKPLLVMPRRAALREQRNDHQLATARRLAELGVVTAAYDEEELARLLDRVEQVPPPGALDGHERERLVEALRGFIHG